MIRIFIIPLMETLVGGITFRAPKYLGGTNQVAPLVGLENIGTFDLVDYGFEPVCIFIAEVTAEQITILSNQADVLTVPVNLDSNLGAGAVTTVKNFLETLHIPAGWVSTSFTYRQILRIVSGLFRYMQALHGLHPVKLFSGGVTLATQFQALSADVQTAMIAAAQTLGIDTSPLQPTTTLRSILKTMADFFNGQEFATSLATF